VISKETKKKNAKKNTKEPNNKERFCRKLVTELSLTC